MRRDHRTQGAGKRVAALLLFLALSFGYGYFAEAADTNILIAVTLVVSIMHFWYDGFIWSVRNKQV